MEENKILEYLNLASQAVLDLMKKGKGSRDLSIVNTHIDTATLFMERDIKTKTNTNVKS